MSYLPAQGALAVYVGSNSDYRSLAPTVKNVVLQSSNLRLYLSTLKLKNKIFSSNQQKAVAWYSDASRSFVPMKVETVASAAPSFVMAMKN